MAAHGITDVRWAEIAQAFRLGGFVTVYEADAYLRLERGTTKRALLQGALKGRTEVWGRRRRHLVQAQDAQSAFAQASVPA